MMANLYLKDTKKKTKVQQKPQMNLLNKNKETSYFLLNINIKK